MSKQLPLPEVVNNQGVAASRRGLDATSYFQQAVAADRNDPDYQFNLALALSHKKDVPGALRAIAQTIRLRPQDTEAQAFQATLRAELPHVRPRLRRPPAGSTQHSIPPRRQRTRRWNGSSGRSTSLLPPGGL